MFLTETKPWVRSINKWLSGVGEFALDHLVPAAVILVIGILIIRIIMSVVNKLLDKSRLEKAAYSLIRTAVRTVLYILLFLIAAARLGLDVTGVIALASVLTLAVSLSVQNALTNVISGFTLLYTKPFSAGDFVEVAGQSGSVQEIGLTYTKLATPDNKNVFIPNGAVTSAQIVNYTVLGKRRLDVRVSASYTSAMQDVMDALKEAGSVETILPEEGVFVAVDSYGESTVNYLLRVWCSAEDYWTTQYAINERVKRIFDEKGVEMTYPHLNVHLNQ